MIKVNKGRNKAEALEKQQRYSRLQLLKRTFDSAESNYEKEINQKKQTWPTLKLKLELKSKYHTVQPQPVLLRAAPTEQTGGPAQATASPLKINHLPTSESTTFMKFVD